MARRTFTPRCGLVGLSRAMTTDPFTLVLTAYLVMAAVMVGLRCHGSGHAWMAPDLDRPDRHGLGAPESHGYPGWSDRLSLAGERTIEPTNGRRTHSSHGFLGARSECGKSVLPRSCFYQLAGQLVFHLIQKPNQPSTRYRINRSDFPPSIASVRPPDDSGVDQ